MKLSGWGRYPVIDGDGVSIGTLIQVTEYLNKQNNFIVYGKGRSYGDSALNGHVLFSKLLNRVLDFRTGQGILTCECGVSLAEIIHLVLPYGWFLSTVPGTKFITLGGAIASDVHGKNHHKAGCFSNSVLNLKLMLPDGQIVDCNQKTNQELFFATCGGMGLTGIIISATLKLQPVKSRSIREKVIRCDNLQHVFSCFEEYAYFTYSVAWIDCLAKGAQQGRSVLMMGEHAGSDLKESHRDHIITVPFSMPSLFLNQYSVALFNELYYRLHSSGVQERLKPLNDFFFPLDKIENWNFMYGRNGFAQYQFVLPKESSLSGLQAVLSKTGEAGLGSFLGVLKLLGAQNNNMLSFPTEGYTLALDFKITNRLFPFLDELDRIVLDHGGRINLCKDARMNSSVFRKGYPEFEEFFRLRARYGMDKKFVSLQSLRLEV
jgi:decaprenylphospho-beta-D-ribofuranose 2-oxidase